MSPLPKTIAAALAAGLVAACSGKSTPQVTPAALAKSDAPAVARISEQDATAAGIQTAQAGPVDLRETVTLYGSIRPNAERQQSLRARYAGVVRSVTKRPGDRVAKGEQLLAIESNDSLEPYPILSPIAGTVLERNVNVGEAVDSSQTLLVVADLSTVWAEFAVFARDLGRIRAGMPVLLQSNDGSLRGEAKIAYIAPAGSSDSQSVVARVVIDNQMGRWVAGQFVTGDVVINDRRAAVAVAPAAIQQLGGDNVVFVHGAQGFSPRKVVIGSRGVESVEILQGLSAGERYATQNSYLIKADLQKGEGEED